MPYAPEIKKKRFQFDFKCGVHSIVTSGHKWPGSPFPTGVLMVLRRTQITSDAICEIAGDDGTFAGSRNAMSPLVFWNYVANLSF